MRKTAYLVVWKGRGAHVSCPPQLQTNNLPPSPQIAPWRERLADAAMFCYLRLAPYFSSFRPNSQRSLENSGFFINCALSSVVDRSNVGILSKIRGRVRNPDIPRFARY